MLNWVLDFFTWSVMHQGNLDWMTTKMFFQNTLGENCLTWLRMFIGISHFRTSYLFRYKNLWLPYSELNEPLSHTSLRQNQRRTLGGVKTIVYKLVPSHCLPHLLFGAEFSCYKKHWNQVKSEEGFKKPHSVISSEVSWGFWQCCILQVV